jgi:hypothetical protein
MTYKTALSFKILFGIALVGAVYLYCTLPTVKKIPEAVYNATSAGKFGNLLTTPHKKIIWFGADCPMSRQKKAAIDLLLKMTQYNTYYEHRPFLQNSLSVEPSDIFGDFILQNCADGICLILPQSRKIVKTTEKKMLKDMKRFLDK